jgi:hypothetical protein
MFNVDVNVDSTFWHRSPPVHCQRCWNENTQKILSCRHSTNELWPKKLKSPELLEAQNTLGQWDLYRGSAARLNHRPLTTPKSWELELPSIRPIHEQQWFGSHVAPGDMLQINWRLEHHVDTATGLKYLWFDRACTYHYCGHILTSIVVLGAGADNNNPQNLDCGWWAWPLQPQTFIVPRSMLSCPSFIPITCQYNTITSEANQSWITTYHRFQKSPIPQTQKVTMDVFTVRDDWTSALNIAWLIEQAEVCRDLISHSFGAG